MVPLKTPWSPSGPLLRLGRTLASSVVDATDDGAARPKPIDPFGYHLVGCSIVLWYWYSYSNSNVLSFHTGPITITITIKLYKTHNTSRGSDAKEHSSRNTKIYSSREYSLLLK